VDRIVAEVIDAAARSDRAALIVLLHRYGQIYRRNAD
jgi:hypothetical protein